LTTVIGIGLKRAKDVNKVVNIQIDFFEAFFFDGNDVS